MSVTQVGGLQLVPASDLDNPYLAIEQHPQDACIYLLSTVHGVRVPADKFLALLVQGKACVRNRIFQISQRGPSRRNPVVYGVGQSG